MDEESEPGPLIDGDDGYLRNLSALLEEWASDEDAAAYDALAEGPEPDDGQVPSSGGRSKDT